MMREDIISLTLVAKYKLHFKVYLNIPNGSNTVAVCVSIKVVAVQKTSSFDFCFKVPKCFMVLSF